MSTGILSTATQLAALGVLSWALLALAVLGEIALGVALFARLLGDRSGWMADASTPASLTGVAATAVIGSRLVPLGRTGTAWALLVVAALLWLVLLPLVLRHWQVPTVGAGFLICVATEGLAVLAGELGAVTGSRPVLVAGLVAFFLGLVLYGTVVARFDWRQLVVGAGDHWVLAGALAITSLAAAELVRADTGRVLLAGDRQPLRVLALAVWAAALAGYALLAACELRRPRLRYDVRRWATVFPMGMTAAASIAVGRAEALPALSVVGRVLLWPALVAWLLTAVAATRHRLAARDHPPGEP